MAADEDGFEAELAAGLEDRARGLRPAGGVPLEELRAAGRRRMFRVRAARVAAAVAVTAGCAALLTLPGGARSAEVGPADPTASPSPTGPAPRPERPPMVECRGGPAALRGLAADGPAAQGDALVPLDLARMNATVVELGNRPEYLFRVCWEDRTLYVMRYAAGGTFDEQVGAAAAGLPSVTVRIVDAVEPWSIQALMAAEIRKDPAVSAVTIRGDGSGLRVVSSQTREQLVERYGPLVAEVVPG